MYYATLILDKGEVLHFSIIAGSTMTAASLLTAYLKGRFEGSGIGGEIQSLSMGKSRGISYRSLI